VNGFVDQLNDSRAPFKPKAPSLAVVICIVVKFDVAPSSDRMGCFVLLLLLEYVDCWFVSMDSLPSAREYD
jgi:hypothetical protein